MFLLSCDIPLQGNDDFAKAQFYPDVPPEIHFPSLELCRRYQPQLSPASCLSNDVPHDTFHKSLLEIDPFRRPGVAFPDYPNFCATERQSFATLEATKCAPNNPDAYALPSYCIPRPLLMDPNTKFPLYVPAVHAPNHPPPLPSLSRKSPNRQDLLITNSFPQCKVKLFLFKAPIPKKNFF